jgi:hypothetical protein
MPPKYQTGAPKHLYIKDSETGTIFLFFLLKEEEEEEEEEEVLVLDDRQDTTRTHADHHKNSK